MSAGRIRTPDQRLRVFVSSTLAELAEERVAVREAVERLHLTPVMFELGARPHPPRDLYRAYLEQSQIFVGLYWQRYGWVAPDEDVSGLEDEYALSQGMPRLLYVKAPAPDREPRLAELLRRIQTDDTASYKPFRTPEELARLVGEDLAVLLSERFAGADSPPPHPLDQRHDNLPVQLSSFVGREREVAAVTQALAEARLVTLTGVGGSGKSRLALHVASELAGDLPEGAWLVELAPLTEPERVPSAVAGVLGVHEQPHQPIAATLAEAVGDQRLLLVLDNCEHLLAAAADLAVSLLQAAPGLRILATSREGLTVPGEVIVAVPSLAIPPEGTPVAELETHSAVRLFAERARAVRPAFTLTPANAPAVVEIVTRLDGIPLALELAAARVKVLSPEQIAARLNDRFRLLSGGARTALPRQQTLQATMDWSYDLLGEGERTLLRRLSVFMGGWTIEAAEAVCCGDGLDAVDVLDLLGRLVDKSLVQVAEGPDENRYRLLETVRQYARERLLEADESSVVRSAHRDWCRVLVETAAARILAADEQVRWLDLLETEHDNLRAALEWSVSLRDATSALRLAVAAAWFWYLRGHWDEARGWLEDSVALNGADPELHAHGSAWAGVFAWRRADLPTARRRAERALAVLGGRDHEGEGLALLVLTLAAMSDGDLGLAASHGRRARDVFRARRHAWGTATALLLLAHVALNRQSDEASALLQESATLLASTADTWSRALALSLQGYDALLRLDLARAEEHYRAGHALTVELGDRSGQADHLLALGHVHLMRGEVEPAAVVLEQNRRLVGQLREPHEIAHADQALALLAYTRGDPEAGEALLADAAGRLAGMGQAPMVGAHTIGMADLYARSGRPALAAVLLRHALELFDERQHPAEYARARQALADLDPSALEPDGTRGPPAAAVPRPALEPTGTPHRQAGAEPAGGPR